MDINNDIIGSSIRFFTNHYLDIILMVLLMIIILIVVTIYNIKLFDDNNENVKKITEKVFFYEGLKNMIQDNDLIQPSHENICDTLQGKSHEIEKMCSGMSKSKCPYLPCCVLASFSNENTPKCVSGNSSGPTYHTDDDGNNINVDYYYWNNNRYE